MRLFRIIIFAFIVHAQGTYCTPTSTNNNNSSDNSEAKAILLGSGAFISAKLIIDGIIAFENAHALEINQDTMGRRRTNDYEYQQQLINKGVTSILTGTTLGLFTLIYATLDYYNQKG